ncbi:hypothetical protein LB565_18515 [Mesorhizobium sp. CA14]|uniref:hypothetical protein n=1 Tax=Mesorhizobium sp. CA14 TaxID=2876642 RepID=UPI001CCCF65D|nr:hypothetical protein [Mesorhizobium sp. CA14]MBZ9849981.1 hypothetical protein [Mesorhizobium sp. CA14]
MNLPDHLLPATDPGTASSRTISPLGTYVVCFKNLADDTQQRATVTVDGILHQRWTNHHRPDHGSQVIWSSNWGVPGGPVYEFVTRVDWSEQHNPKEVVANGQP